MIGKYDPDVVQNLMPLIVNVLGKVYINKILYEPKDRPKQNRLAKGPTLSVETGFCV